MKTPHEKTPREKTTTDLIDLAEVMNALRKEFAKAVDQARDEQYRFALASMDLEFQVGVTKSASAEGGIHVWVLALGGTAGYAHESVQKVTLHLTTPEGYRGPVFFTTPEGYRGPTSFWSDEPDNSTGSDHPHPKITGDESPEG